MKPMLTKQNKSTDHYRWTSEYRSSKHRAPRGNGLKQAEQICYGMLGGSVMLLIFAFLLWVVSGIDMEFLGR
jgi:hypothetical protein